MEKFFKLKEHGTTISTEVLAGFSTFFAMAYILIVNPQILGISGLPEEGVYIATIFAAVIGTMVMGLFANVPYAQAPGMGLNAFFTFTVVIKYGYSPYEALALVFICGIINIIITITKIRKQIIKAIPETLQNAIGAGIGMFIAYIGLLNIGFIQFGDGVPAIASFSDPNVQLMLFGLILTIALLIFKVKGSILIGIIATTVLGILMGVVSINGLSFTASSYNEAFSQFGTLFGKALSSEGIGSLFSKHSLIEIFPIIFAFSLTDTFDTIGTFIGTGRRSGIFSAEDEKALEEGSGFSSKMDKAMFADSIATSVGSVLGTSNTTTFVESSVGIEAGGRTGLTSIVVCILFLASIIFAPLVTIIPSAATAPALIIVGILMSGSFKDIDWADFEVAVPAFMTVLITVLTYNISNGLAFGFIFYMLVQVCKGNWKKVHPIVYISSVLFILYFLMG